MTKYVTNFCRDAIDHWSNYEAVREIIQNALDSDGELEYEITEDSITLTNKGIQVSNKLLVMGLSDKRDDPSKRGRYGTGSVMSMCVLTARGLGVTFYNNDVVWVPRFEHCDKFGMEVMVVDEAACTPTGNFSVTVTGLSEDDITDIKQTSLLFQDREVLATSKYGDIIANVDDYGEVYCGDLFVMQLQGFTYSYNIKPEYLKLNQDRNATSEWDLQTVTANLIIDTGDNELIQTAIELNTKDTHHVKYYSYVPAAVCDTLAEDFVAEHKGSVVTFDYCDHQHNEKTNVASVFVGNAVKAKAIQDSAIYQESIEDIELVEKQTPREVVDAFSEKLQEFLSHTSLDNSQHELVVEMLNTLEDVSDNWDGDTEGLPF